MPTTPATERPFAPFSLPDFDRRRWSGRWLARMRAPAQALIGLDALNEIYAELPSAAATEDFLAAALAQLGLRVEVAPEDLAAIPRTGPVLVVANHPFGAIDGLVLGSVLRGQRPDAKLLVNHLLGRLPELRELFVFADVFRRESSTNRAAMRAALRWLQDGHLLAAFPAGQVSHLQLDRRGVVDGAWGAMAARLARLAGATVVPVWFAGRNSALFQLSGLVHERLRTVLLPRELLRRRGARVELRIGSPIAPERLAEFEREDCVTEHLRERVYLLAERAARPHAQPHAQEPRTAGAREPLPSSLAAHARWLRDLPTRAPLLRRVPPHEQVLRAPMAAPVDGWTLAGEFARLPAERRLAESGPLAVWRLRMREAPNVLCEIGRLRELTFRQVGEGTGRELDLDAFDEHYEHLVLWNAERREIAGAYRCAFAQPAPGEGGARGLYTATLFDYAPDFFAQLGPALELGRSFVRSEYQRSFSPLMLLWKGIGACVLAQPGCRTLFGAVSISASYHPRSRELIVEWLAAQRAHAELSTQLRPRSPLPARRTRAASRALARALGGELEELSRVVADLEPGRRGVPVLLREYVKLGGRVAGFNLDRAFSDALDALVVVDLARTDARTLGRYLGREAAARFLAEHREAAQSAA